LRAIESMDAGSVRIVASEGFVDGLLQQVVAPFCAAHPKLGVALDALPVSDMVEALADDSAHMAIAYNPPSDPRLRIVARAAAPAKLLVRAGHPLTQVAAPLRLKHLQPYPLALMPPAYGVGRLVELLEYAERVTLHRSFTSNSVAALKRFVRETDGVSVIGAGLGVTPEVQAGELATLEMAYPLCRQAQVCLLIRHGRPLSVAAGNVLASISGMFSVFRRA
jgi:DNA-binding transcriptional LysR family regulator